MTIYAEVITIGEGNSDTSVRSTAQDYNEILLVSEGRGVFSADDADYPISSGNIILIASERKYSISSTDVCRLISVSGSFDKPFLFDGIKIIRDNIYSEGKKLAELILYNRFGNDAYVGRLCDAYVEYLSLNIDLEPKNTTAAIYKIISKMEKNFSQSELSIGALLDESGYARDYIRIEFEAVTKMTPKRYLNNVRMKNAAAMIDLYGDDLSLSEIAEKCGIIDSSIFSRVFKKHFGISPSEYKNKKMEMKI